MKRFTVYRNSSDIDATKRQLKVGMQIAYGLQRALEVDRQFVTLNTVLLTFGVIYSPHALPAARLLSLRKLPLLRPTLLKLDYDIERTVDAFNVCCDPRMVMLITHL